MIRWRKSLTSYGLNFILFFKCDSLVKFFLGEFKIEKKRINGLLKSNQLKLGVNNYNRSSA